MTDVSRQLDTEQFPLGNLICCAIALRVRHESRTHDRRLLWRSVRLWLCYRVARTSDIVCRGERDKQCERFSHKLSLDMVGVHTSRPHKHTSALYPWPSALTISSFMSLKWSCRMSESMMVDDLKVLSRFAYL